MKCIKCGKNIPDNSQFCTYCGKKINQRRQEDFIMNKKRFIIIGIALIIIIIGFIFFEEVQKNNINAAAYSYSSSALYNIYIYDKDINCNIEKEIGMFKNYYSIIFKAGNDYTRKKYGNEVLKVTFEKGSREIINITGNSKIIEVVSK